MSELLETSTVRLAELRQTTFVPIFRPDALFEAQDDDWVGEYHCPCQESKFDLAGRVFKSVPAPTNLIIPPLKCLDASTLVIGTDDAHNTA